MTNKNKNNNTAAAIVNTAAIAALVAQYESEFAQIQAAKIALEDSLEQSRATLQELYTEHGPGPYTINGAEVGVLFRRGQFQVMPSKRPRKLKVVEPTVNTAPVQALVAELPEADVAVYESIVTEPLNTADEADFSDVLDTDETE